MNEVKKLEDSEMQKMALMDFEYGYYNYIKVSDDLINVFKEFEVIMTISKSDFSTILYYKNKLIKYGKDEVYKIMKLSNKSISEKN